MPGNYRWSVDLLVEECKSVRDLGLRAVILFGIPETKDDVGSGAYDPNGIVQRAVRAVKKSVPDLLVICDTCLDEYTSHGHCGLVKDGEVENDSTLELLAQAALTQAEAGADMVAPSDMMDGRVGRIREELDAHEFSDIPIMVRQRILPLTSETGGPIRWTRPTSARPCAKSRSILRRVLTSSW